MKWSGLFSKIQRASALSVASGVVAATCSLGILVDSVGAAEPPEAKAGSAAQSSDETNRREQLSDADKIALAKHNRLVSTAAISIELQKKVRCSRTGMDSNRARRDVLRSSQAKAPSVRACSK